MCTKTSLTYLMNLILLLKTTIKMYTLLESSSDLLSVTMHTALSIKAYIYRKTLYTNWLISYLSDSIIGLVLEKHRDVILVTGGTQGLGRQIVLEFLKKGVQRIVVFDIKEPVESDRFDGVYYYQCDVSDKNQVLQLSEKVKNQIGIVTVVINSAGITSGKSFVDLSIEEIEKIIQVNLMSHFYINKAFLPDMLALKRGYIITVASVLGYMSPSNLSAYGASKSALIALHESLTYELGPPMFSKTGVKTLLVCPGQLKTELFKGVNTPSSIFAPELNPQYVAQKIVEAVQYGRRGELKFPIYGNFLPLFRSLPWPTTQFIRYVSGMDESMKTYQHPVPSPPPPGSHEAIVGTIVSSNSSLM